MKYPLIELLQKIGFEFDGEIDRNFIIILLDLFGDIRDVRVMDCADTVLPCGEIQFRSGRDEYRVWCEKGILYGELLEIETFDDSITSFQLSRENQKTILDCLIGLEDGSAERIHYSSAFEDDCYYQYYDSETICYIESCLGGICKETVTYLYSAKNLHWKEAKQEFQKLCPDNVFPLPDQQIRIARENRTDEHWNIYEQYFDTRVEIIRGSNHTDNGLSDYENFQCVLSQYRKMGEREIVKEFKK